MMTQERGELGGGQAEQDQAERDLQGRDGRDAEDDESDQRGRSMRSRGGVFVGFIEPSLDSSDAFTGFLGAALAAGLDTASRRASALITARSAHDGQGLATCRRNTANW
ncbi:hypothetical protein AB0392_10620 [Nonomuraea angiospora]|uniref:hypothetical protein n=1 Tax=Nonomuraea angiospora TaxID=46172 RepID=UPI00344C9C3F